MGKSVSNLKIAKQSDSDNTYYASWSFDEKLSETKKIIKVGQIVGVKDGAKFYNGTTVTEDYEYIYTYKWKVTKIEGDAIFLGPTFSGAKNMSFRFHINDLTSVDSETTIYYTLDNFEVKWYYDTGDGIWFEGSSSGGANTSSGDGSVGDNTTQKEVPTYSIYNPPNNFQRIKVWVKPVSRKYLLNKKETTYWTGDAKTATYSFDQSQPADLSVPTVTIDKYSLTASVENITDPRTDEVNFEVWDATKKITSGSVVVTACRASFTCNVTAGVEYRVRCRSVNTYQKNKLYGNYSDFSSAINTMPLASSGITLLKATSATSVYLEWSKSNTATSYEIEYTTKKEYFDSSDRVTSIKDIETTRYTKHDLTSGEEYFFRVRAVNDKGSSAWTEIKSIILGKKPAAPSTWSSTTTAVVGEPLTLYWIHSSTDNSSQVKAELEMYVDGVCETHEIVNSTNEEEKDRTSSYSVSTSTYKEGVEIQWRVRTMGITSEYGDWSIQRTVNVYAPPVMTLSITDQNGDSISTLTAFPFYIGASVAPVTQSPTGYQLSIIANGPYTTVDEVGNTKNINKGTSVYSKYFNTSEDLLLEISANSVDLQTDQEYTIECTASLNSGLTAESSTVFDVLWTDEEYTPDVEIAMDNETFTAFLKPYCRNNLGELVDDITLSIYRREYDGTYTEIASNLDNLQETTVADPHPSLDYARYRVVAITKSTGAVSFYDAPGYPIGESSVIIQWDEAWSSFDTSNEDAMEQPPWSGSLIKIPYNIDISDSYSFDVSLVEYIGRKHPVSYYGTQIGETATWNMVIPKDDKATLYALRRLARWAGDVYIREPSGSGYWANVSISFNQNHGELTIPISMSVTRVEGGV